MAMLTRSGHDLDYLIQRDRIHGSVYSDPALYAEEMEKIWRKGWVYVGHTSEVPEPGDYRLTSIAGESVIMVRDQDGDVQLVMNRCAHRANAVCQAERGNASFFRCAYHGWTYKCSGELVGVTYADAFPDTFRRDEIGLSKPPRMDSYRGFIFGSLSPTGISLADHLGLATREIDKFVNQSPLGEIDLRAGVNKHQYRANWKFQFENTMDNYHVNFTHQAIMSRRRSSYMTPPAGQVKAPPFTMVCRGYPGGHSSFDRIVNDPEFVGNSGGPGLDNLSASPWGREYLEAMKKGHGEQRAREILALGSSHSAIFPNLMFVQHEVRTIIPVSPTETIKLGWPALLKGAPEELNEARLRSHEGFFGPAGGGAPDDLEMFARNQVGLSSTVNPWLTLQRGIHTEYDDADGTRVGRLPDELPQRHFWHHWKSVLAE